MKNVTLEIENRIKEFVQNLSWIMRESNDIDKAYFSSDASTKVTALSNSTDGASLATKLTKGEYTNAITFIEQMINFFANSAVSTGDYLSTIDQVKYGSAASPALLSDATEDIANRIKILFDLCLTNYVKAKDILDLYNNSELSVLVAGLSSGRVVYGANINTGELSAGITLVEQFKNMIANSAVTTGSYSDSVAIWMLLD